MNKWYVASVYGSGQYGNCSYSDDNCVAAQGSSGVPSNSNSQLVNTGIGIVVIITIACLISIVAILVRAARRRKPVKPNKSGK